ncbi:MAG: Aminoacyltransferase femX, partial [Frankiales bacterium]|nr:Aminoacyltransferase femX [Frankiales bacterium]
MKGLTLRRVPLAEVDWQALDRYPDRLLFQRRPWLDFLQECHSAEPVVAEVCRGGETCGWLTGLMTRHLGFRVLGAPRPGWTTPYLGFNLEAGTSRREAVAALPAFAFKELGCVHVEVCDRSFVPTDLAGLEGRRSETKTFVLDLRPELDEISARMTSGTRQNLRKGCRSGIEVEDAEPEGFAEEYYGQLRDVFAKQGLVPSYSAARVESLIRHLHPTGDLQLIRVRAPEGESIATGLVLGVGTSAYFWGGASWRRHQHLRPNEALFWHAFTTWRARGAQEFDFGGGGTYKVKYGATELRLHQLRWSRWPGVEAARSLVRASTTARQRAVGSLLRRGVNAARGGDAAGRCV